MIFHKIQNTVDAAQFIVEDKVWPAGIVSNPATAESGVYWIPDPGLTISPRDWVLTDSQGNISVMTDVDFKGLYSETDPVITRLDIVDQIFSKVVSGESATLADAITAVQSSSSDPIKP